MAPCWTACRERWLLGLAERVNGNQRLVNDPSANQMFLDDALEHRGVALSVPCALWIHDRNRTAFANPKAVGLRAQDAALLRQSELPQAALQKVPRRKPALLVAALRVRLIAAEKNVAARDGYPDRFRHAQFTHETLHYRGHPGRGGSSPSGFIHDVLSVLRVASHTEFLRIPSQPEFARRRHVADERRRGDDGGTGKIAFTAETHAILPVAVERSNCALPL